MELTQEIILQRADLIDVAPILVQANLLILLHFAIQMDFKPGADERLKMIRLLSAERNESGIGAEGGDETFQLALRLQDISSGLSNLRTPILNI